MHLVAADVGRSLIFYRAPAVLWNPWIPLAEPRLKTLNWTDCGVNSSFVCGADIHLYILLLIVIHDMSVCRRCIRAALIQQTEIHFRQYAKQQFPDNVQQVETLRRVV